MQLSNGKRILQRGIDRFQFWFDVFPRYMYQPLPWLGIHQARRSQGTNDRWRAIQEHIVQHDIGSAMDVGCHVGFFCFALSAMGIPSLGIDGEDRAIRVASFAAQQLRKQDATFQNASFARLRVCAETVSLLPQVDLALVLSVWHHWVHDFGLTIATEMLGRIWQKTNKLMFFETGGNEMPGYWGMPQMGADPEDWILDYLRSTCVGAVVLRVGKFKAFAPGGDNHTKVVYRTLFRVMGTSDARKQLNEVSVNASLMDSEFLNSHSQPNQ